MKHFQKNKWMFIPFLFVIVGVILIFTSDAIENAFIGEKTSEGDASKKEREIAAFLEQGKDIDEVTVKLCLDGDGRVTGAAVICQGGEDAATKAMIVRLLSAALGLPSNKIEVSGKG